MRFALATMILGGGLLCGCSHNPQRTMLAVRPAVEVAEDWQVIFAAGDQLLAGFSPAAAPRPWWIGDRVLFGLHLQAGDEHDTRYVLLTIKTPPLRAGARVAVLPFDVTPNATEDVDLYAHHPHGANPEQVYTAQTWRASYGWKAPDGKPVRLHYVSRPILAALDVFDADAAWLGTSFVMLPESILRTGMYDLTAARVAWREQFGDDFPEEVADDPLPDGRLEDWAQLVNGLYALTEILWKCPQVVPLLSALQPPPDPLSILLHLGVRVSLKALPSEFAEVDEQLPASADERRILRLPLGVFMNDAPMVRCDLLVAEPNPPLHAAAGLAGADVWRLKGAPARLSVRVLAARDGEPPQTSEMQGNRILAGGYLGG